MRKLCSGTVGAKAKWVQASKVLRRRYIRASAQYRTTGPMWVRPESLYPCDNRGLMVSKWKQGEKCKRWSQDRQKDLLLCIILFLLACHFMLSFCRPHPLIFWGAVGALIRSTAAEFEREHFKPLDGPVSFWQNKPNYNFSQLTQLRSERQLNITAALQSAPPWPRSFQGKPRALNQQMTHIL